MIFFNRSISSECFLFTNLTLTRLVPPVLLFLSINRWQPSISMRPILITAFLQISITLTSRMWSRISWGIPETSTLFLLLYCFAYAWLTRFSSKVSTVSTTIKWLLSFSFDSISFARFFDKWDTWSKKFLMLLSTISFPFNFSVLLTGSFFFIALIVLNDNSKTFAVFSAITINQVHVEELKISQEHQ